MENITQRDFFAGMALAALINRQDGPLSGFAAMSRQAFLIADQMVKTREEELTHRKEQVA